MTHRARSLTGWSGAFFVVVVCSFVPVLWIIFLSLKTPATVTDGSFVPHQWTLSNYSAIFNTGIFTDALRNSIGIGLISTAFAVVLASAAAYAIARLDFPGKRAILAISLTSTTAAETVPASIAQFPGASQFTVPIGDIAAAAVVVTVPVMVLVLLFQRRIVAGLTAGAVKG